MKRIIFILVTLFALLLSVGIWSCEDDSNPCANYTEQEKTKNYEWSLGNFDKGEECLIIKQAKHSKISKLDESANYKYVPQANFTGTDIVDIKTKTKEADGINVCETTYRLTFAILECGMKTERKLISKTIYDPCPDYTKQERTKKYEWEVGDFGVREGCKILKQAEHSQVSELDKNNTYRYEPEENFRGTDVVEIETETSSKDGLTGHIIVYKIVFTVTECGLKTAKTVMERKDVKYQKLTVFGPMHDNCAEYSRYRIMTAKNFLLPENLPDEFKIHKLKVLINFTFTGRIEHCGMSPRQRFIIINRIKKDIEQ